jgi:hypothetical protein
MSNDISIFNDGAMNSMIKFSEIMATSTIAIPKDYRGNPGNCMAVIMQAQRWGMDPYIVASKTHVVSGNLGYEAQLVNAVITSSNAIKGRFHYEYSENEWKDDKDPNAWIRVGAQITGEDGIQWGEKLYPSKVAVKNSPLWKTNPKQQSAYLAVKMWSRLYTPHVIMGVYTRDEVQEISQERDVTPTKSTLNIPAGTNLETGEIPEDKPETVETLGDPTPPTVETLKKLMNDCDTIDRMKAYSDLIVEFKGSFSIEELANVKSHYINRCETLKAEAK